MHKIEKSAKFQLFRRFRSGAFYVGLGILLSRVFGLLREKIFAHYFGNSLSADAFKAALRIPNFIQNLLGEGVLSASFIPVYARLLAEKKEDEAREVASVAASFLFLLTSFLVLLGVLWTPQLVDMMAPGFSGERRELTEKMVYIFFPSVGVLVLSAFCLGVLNSHRRFFLPYVAPVLWNLAIIFSMVYFGENRNQKELIILVAWGVFAGSVLQVILQLPLTWRLSKKLHWNLKYKNSYFSTVWKNFIPALISRGVIQVSSFIDSILASWLVTGAVSVLSYAQILYLLPISLFGMSISASELAEMSRTLGEGGQREQWMKSRLEGSLRRMNFFVIPSMVGFVFLGRDLIRILYQGGSFSEADTWAVWVVLVGYALSLVSSTEGRLFNSTFYSLNNTKTPLRWSIVQVSVSTLLGSVGIYVIRTEMQIQELWTPLVLTLASSFASWVVWYGVRKKLRQILGRWASSLSYKLKLLGVSVLCAGLAFVVGAVLNQWGGSSTLIDPRLGSFLQLLVYGVFYLGISYKLKLFKNI